MLSKINHNDIKYNNIQTVSKLTKYRYPIIDTSSFSYKHDIKFGGKVSNEKEAL